MNVVLILKTVGLVLLAVIAYGTWRNRGGGSIWAQ